jgi:hypothetical protein
LLQKVLDVKDLHGMGFASHVFSREINAVATAALLASAIVQVYPNLDRGRKNSLYHCLWQNSNYLF